MALNKIMLFVLLLLHSASYAQDHPKTILWKVTKAGSQHESYLFGTFHEVSPSFFNSLTNAVEKLIQSDIIFVESLTSNSSGQAVTSKVKWNQKRWSNLLPDAQMQVFSDFVSKADDSSYYRLNPLFLLLTTSRLYYTNFCDSTMTSLDLMDTHIEKMALRHNKKVYALDTDQGLELEKAVTESGSRQDSLYAANSIQYMKSMLENDLAACDFINAYKSFNLDYALDTDLNQYTMHSPLLTARNTQWTNRLNQAFDSNNCFVAVGFKHLFYKQGLIQQLRALGYLVTPMGV